MAYAARRTIPELGALYDLEPEIRDVFVEGADDAAVLEWYLRHRSDRPVSVMEIGAIDVPSVLVEAYKLDVGNRGRLIALAEELDSQLCRCSRSCPTLVYDADSDRLFGSPSSVEMLIPTDFACLEMYLFNKPTVDKMISLVLKGRGVSADRALNALASVLVRLWIIKTANHMLGFSMSWMSFDGCCKLSGTSIAFDESTFIERYLMKNGRLKERDRFSGQMSKIEARLQADPRHQMNGHHFFILARSYFRHFAKEREVLVLKGAFERAFFGCLELGALDGHPLFQRLLGRVAT